MNKITGKELIDKCLTIRQYFAALAMQGMLARMNTDLDNIAACAVDAADFLIAELNRNNQDV